MLSCCGAVGGWLKQYGRTIYYGFYFVLIVPNNRKAARIRWFSTAAYRAGLRALSLPPSLFSPSVLTRLRHVHIVGVNDPT